MTTAINGRTHGPQVGGVNFPDEPIVEVNAPTILPPGFEADVLPDEGFADKTTAALPLDFAIGPHSSGDPTLRITRRSWAAIPPPTGVIDLDRRDQAEGFMGTIFIVNLPPVLK